MKLNFRFILKSIGKYLISFKNWEFGKIADVATALAFVWGIYTYKANDKTSIEEKRLGREKDALQIQLLKQQLDDNKEFYVKQNSLLNNQVQATLMNLELVKQQTKLNDREISLYERQMQITKKQYEIQQNEFSSKLSEGYLKLKLMILDIEGMIDYPGQNRDLFFYDFNNVENRKMTLNNIKNRLVNESSNFAITDAINNNDELITYWLWIKSITDWELRLTGLQSMKIDDIIISDTRKLNEMELIRFWEFNLTLHRKLLVLRGLIDKKTKNMKISKTINDTIRSKYEDSIMLKSIYTN